MLHMTYKNDLGVIRFGGGKDEDCTWKVLSIDGLGLTAKSFNTVSYPLEVGQSTISETIGARTITISCDLIYPNSTGWMVSKALKVLNEPGVLSLYSGCSRREIEARCVEAAPGERYGEYSTFVMQFVCDYPYFEDRDNTIYPIFEREDLMCGEVVLPVALTHRTSETIVINGGDVDTAPVITINIKGNPYTGDDAGTLTVINSTTKQSLKFDFDTDDEEDVPVYEGDTVIINISERKIYKKGDVDENSLISYLSQDSYLSDFWLKRGTNHIVVENHVSSFCTVLCEFSNKHIEAVIV